MRKRIFLNCFSQNVSFLADRINVSYHHLLNESALSRLCITVNSSAASLIKKKKKQNLDQLKQRKNLYVDIMVIQKRCESWCDDWLKALPIFNGYSYLWSLLCFFLGLSVSNSLRTTSHSVCLFKKKTKEERNDDVQDKTIKHIDSCILIRGQTSYLHTKT